MRKLIIIILLIMSSFLCAAQNEIIVKGLVLGENGRPLSGTLISATDADRYTKSDSEGRFELKIPEHVKELRAERIGYHTVSQKVDSTFLVFDMKMYQDYATRVSEIVSIEHQLALDEKNKLIEEEAKKVQDERVAKKNVLIDEYNKQFKNQGLVHSLEFSYGYQIGKGDVVYKNLGYREFENLNPIELNYIIGYRFDYRFSVGVGFGLQYQVDNLCLIDDVFEPTYANIDEFTPFNIPVFLNTKMYFSMGNVQPLISFSGGIYLPNSEIMLDLGIGANLRLNTNTNMYVMFSFRSTPYPEFKEYSSTNTMGNRPAFNSYYHRSAFTPSLKIGLTL